ncbi:hypothetical protein [Occultella kanbiaonis]|uniref:hypothetical protein n=1 Tax=Occultella kanbiaonis TaxID=2675754 RepID=UPI0012B70745|nr:hypothetical protein [Occultella kanbiaonis]
MTETVTGTWFVVRTSLPFWRHRRDPRISYLSLPDGRVLDAVRYTRRGRERWVLGIDLPVPGGGYRWRGLGSLTRLTSSMWRVVHAEEDWAVTYFARTLFTPAGVDVYARGPTLGSRAERSALAQIAADPSAAEHLDELFAPAHGGA